MQIDPTEINPTRRQLHDGNLQQTPGLTNLNDEKVEDKSQMICQGLPVKRTIITERTPKETAFVKIRPLTIAWEVLGRIFGNLTKGVNKINPRLQ